MSKGTLTVFDLDDTLFKCHAKLYVVQPDGERKHVHSSATYNLEEGEEYDYSEFRSAKLFYDTAIPIDRMVKKFKKIHKERDGHDRIIILTARADFDDAGLFLAALDNHGIYDDSIHVHRAGNLEQIPTTPLRKAHIVRSYLCTDVYHRTIMFDDAYCNLDAFLEISPGYSHIEFEAYHVNHKGKAIRYGS
jgi:hypothetical protein